VTAAVSFLWSKAEQKDLADGATVVYVSQVVSLQKKLCYLPVMLQLQKKNLETSVS